MLHVTPINRTSETQFTKVCICICDWKPSSQLAFQLAFQSTEFAAGLYDMALPEPSNTVIRPLHVQVQEAETNYAATDHANNKSAVAGSMTQ